MGNTEEMRVLQGTRGTRTNRGIRTCLLCQKTISASSTTSLRSHLTVAHKNVLIENMCADEALDPGSYVTLKSLMEDFGSVEKYKDKFKKALDEQFVKMCCKKRMPLSIGKSQ